MEHFVLDLHRTILENELSDDSPYVAAGPIFSNRFSPHFSGNFWIAKCSYINTLPRMHEVDTTDRLQGEFWIGKGPDFMEKHKDCFDFPRPQDKCSGMWICIVPRSQYETLSTCHRP